MSRKLQGWYFGASKSSGNSCALLFGEQTLEGRGKLGPQESHLATPGILSTQLLPPKLELASQASTRAAESNLLKEVSLAVSLGDCFTCQQG